MTKPFGEDLWKNVQSVKVSRNEGIEIPVRADGDGIRLGVDAVATGGKGIAPAPARSRFGSIIRRLLRRST